MSSDEVDLYGKICPYPVVRIVQEVHKMRSGELKIFCVDDPLAIKSVPEELADVEGLHISIEPRPKGWNIIISKEQ
jgi:TusA-related sulfurtransferase